MMSTGKEAFKAANMTGKLIVFHHNLPVAPAPGQLKNRDDRKSLGTDKEKAVLLPQTKFYNDLGQECVAVGCSVDLFLFNNAYIDIATLSQVSRMTGGQVYKYTYFQVNSSRPLNQLLTIKMTPTMIILCSLIWTEKDLFQTFTTTYPGLFNMTTILFPKYLFEEDVESTLWTNAVELQKFVSKV